MNEKTASISDLWVGINLRCTFRRCFDDRLVEQWETVVQLVTTVELKDEEDRLIWQLNASGRYSSHSLYGVVNFGGIKPVFTPAVWKIHIPPRVHFFLWLLSKNKILTRDNLALRQKVDDKSCVFCEEKETVNHLFFECVVAKLIW